MGGLTAAEDSKLSAVMSPESLKALKGGVQEQVAVSKCPGGHGLKQFPTPEEGRWCSNCQKVHVKGASFWGCRECDYDECETCALMPLSRRNGKVPQAASPVPPPAQSPAEEEEDDDDEDDDEEPSCSASSSAPQQQQQQQQQQQRTPKKSVK